MSNSGTSAENIAFVTELKERGIVDAIIKKCQLLKINSISDLRNLSFEKLTEDFRNDESLKTSAINWRHLEALWSGEELPKDYVPPIRKQLMDIGVKRKYADFYATHDIYDLKNVSEEVLGEASSFAKRAKLDNVEADIKAMRSKIRMIEKDSEAEPTALEDDPRIKALIKNKTLISGELEKLMTKAKDMEGVVEKALKDLDTTKLESDARAELMANLEKLKADVIAPDDLDEVGKYFKGISAVDDLDQKSLFDSKHYYGKSYNKYEDLVAYASGGQARCGFHVDLKHQTVDACSIPVLARPSRVESLGVTAPFSCKVVKTTSEMESNRFIANTYSFGVSTADKMHETRSKSAVGFWGMVGAQSTSAKGTTQEDIRVKLENERRSEYVSSEVSSVQLIEYMSLPMKSFRLPRSEMILSDDALYELRRVTDTNKAKQFLERFGSHVTNAKRTYGGVFFRKITLDSKNTMEANKMFGMAGDYLQKIKKESTRSERGVAVMSPWGAGGLSSINSNNQSNSETEERNTTDTNESSRAENECSYCSTVESLGPNATTTEDFYKFLNEDDSSWAIMDSEKIEKYLVPVWDLIRDHRQLIMPTTEMGTPLMTNEQLAELVYESWNKELGIDVRDELNDGKSLESVLAEKSAERLLWEQLSSIIFASGGGMKDKDALDIAALNKAVELAAERMASGQSNKPTRQNWIEDFFIDFVQQGNNQLDEDQKKSVRQFLRAHRNNPDRLEHDHKAHTIANDNVIDRNDWINLSEYFRKHTTKELNNSAPRFEGLPLNNISGVHQLGPHAHFFSGKKCYQWNLVEDKFQDESLTASAFKALFATSKDKIYGKGGVYHGDATTNFINGFDPIHGGVDAAFSFRPDESARENTTCFFQGSKMFFWDNTLQGKSSNSYGAAFDMHPDPVLKLYLAANENYGYGAFWNFPASGIDAVLSTDQDGIDEDYNTKAYAFAGKQYYEVNHAKKKGKQAEIKGETSAFLDLEKIDADKIDAVFTYPREHCPFYAKGIAYFFAGDKYYMYDLNTKEVSRGYKISSN